jgi:D-serine deaminase-like pyridoxal phosphate-dependent protein
MVAERLQAATSNMITRASGLPIRLATKSIRCRAIINRMLARSGYQGVLTYSLSEAIWLAGSGIRDVLLAYPTVDQNALTYAECSGEPLETGWSDSVPSFMLTPRLTSANHRPNSK